MAKKAAKKKAVKKDPFNRRLKSAKFKNIDKDKAIEALRELIKRSNGFLNLIRYRHETLINNKIFTYDDLYNLLYQCEIISTALEVGIEPENDKKGFTAQELAHIEEEWGWEIRDSTHKSLHQLLGSMSEFDDILDKAHLAINQLDSEFVADEWSKNINGKTVRVENPDNTTVMWMYKD